MKIDEKTYKEIAEFIHSNESPVGIDAKKRTFTLSTSSIK